MNTVRVLLAVMMLGALCAGVGEAQEKKFEMVPVKYNGLKEEVLKHRGKVLVVDFWAGY